MTVRRASFVLPCLLLAACQVTTFESAPLVSEVGCDPALQGSWVSGDEGGEVRLDIDATCTLTFSEREFDGWKIDAKPPTTLHVGRHGGQAYGWVDSRWALLIADEGDRTLPEGDVVIARYRVDGDTLSVWNTDDKAIAHAIVDGDLSGRTEVEGHDIINRLTGKQEADVLDHDGFFEAEPEVFQRWKET